METLMIALYYIQGLAALMAVIAVGIYLLARRDDVLKTAAIWLLFFALLFGVMPFLWGCGSPTAPTDVYRLTWSPAPGCSPGTIPQEPPSHWIGWIQAPGSDRLTVIWVGFSAEFRQFGTNYLFCREVKP